MENKKPYSVSFLPAARNDILEIISAFMMLGSKQGAVRIQKGINDAAEMIADFPYSGVRIHDEKLAKYNFRMVIIEKYLMFYRVFDETETVLIYRIINGKRDYPNILKSYTDEFK